MAPTGHDRGMPPLFAAILINEITVENPAHVPQFEESVLLFTADSLEDAERHALAYGREQEHEYTNVVGETVRWSFRKLADVNYATQDDLSAERLAAGVEVHSRFFHDLTAYEAADGSPDEARWSPELELH